MQLTSGRAVFSPSDLNHFLECEHLIQLELRRGDAPRAERDAHAELLAQKGLDHEKAWLDRFRAEGRTIVEIDGGPARDWERDAERTIAAMHDGVDVIYQGVFIDDVRSVRLQADQPSWRGISDFLVRRDNTYEAWDTKLARSSKPSFVLQLCFYTEQLARIHGREPEQMHIVLGTGQVASFRYSDFAAYYRVVRRRFLQAMQSGIPTSPYPVSHCSLCHHQQTCQDQWHADDHLSQLAGITREQVERFNVAGIKTIAQLAKVGIGDRGLGIGEATLARLHHQAQLQSGHRETGIHKYELLPADERSGFRLMPEPSPGDIFFDMEGDPYFEPASGLEYLFGAQTSEGFRYFQALTREEEKRAFEQFIDWVHERLQQWPDLHVYHYAAYEITALKRLMSTHATREDELDELLRREVFVDLFQVVRQSLRHSHNKYSIKKVRTFFMEGAGQGAVTDGGDSILMFERFLDSGDESLLKAIIDYNEEDCVSTLQLRDWLLERKTDAESDARVVIPWKTVEQKPENPKRVEEDAQTAARISTLVGAAFPSTQLGAGRRPENELLAHLLGYHRREAKPEWWAYFDRQKKSLDDLLDDTQAIAWLDPVPGDPEIVKQSLVYALRFPDQEFKLAAGTSIIDPFTGESPGTLEWVKAAGLRLGLKRGKKRTEPLPAAVCAGAPIDDSAQRGALGRLADAVVADVGRDREAAPPKYAALRAILANEPPRVRSVRLQADPKAVVAALDNSYLFIQGPPGSGKTWTGARLIVSLIAAGKRIGVAANSHKAINNLLREVEAVAIANGVTFEGLKKGSGDDACGGRLIRDTDDNKEVEGSSAQLIAGTGWLFSREGMDQTLDYLFIDEAGQVSLADAIAMGTAARNIVLLGDPQQLPQVRQGIHPEGSGCSVLEHLLRANESVGRVLLFGPAENKTVSEDRGIFLAQTWRMHPDVCRFISDLSYDGRLESAPGRERQRIDSAGLSGTGLRYIPVEHTGNSQQSPEEAAAIAAEVEKLLAGGTFTDHEGQTRPLTPRDILIVAPYNMQVRCIREKLPEGVEVGTVDKFQGREAPVVFFSMASSTGEDVPRGLEFLFNRNRFNVAISRAKALAVVVGSPRLQDVRCSRVEQIPLINMLCRYAESAT
jgi:uncharacterized protein